MILLPSLTVFFPFLCFRNPSLETHWKRSTRKCNCRWEISPLSNRCPVFKYLVTDWSHFNLLPRNPIGLSSFPFDCSSSHCASFLSRYLRLISDIIWSIFLKKYYEYSFWILAVMYAMLKSMLFWILTMHLQQGRWSLPLSFWSCFFLFGLLYTFLLHILKWCFVKSFDLFTEPMIVIHSSKLCYFHRK